jgi:hypothetical protein
MACNVMKRRTRRHVAAYYARRRMKSYPGFEDDVKDTLYALRKTMSYPGFEDDVKEAEQLGPILFDAHLHRMQKKHFVACSRGIYADACRPMKREPEKLPPPSPSSSSSWTHDVIDLTQYLTSFHNLLTYLLTYLVTYLTSFLNLLTYLLLPLDVEMLEVRSCAEVIHHKCRKAADNGDIIVIE